MVSSINITVHCKCFRATAAWNSFSSWFRGDLGCLFTTGEPLLADTVQKFIPDGTSKTEEIKLKTITFLWTGYDFGLLKSQVTHPHYHLREDQGTTDSFHMWPYGLSSRWDRSGLLQLTLCPQMTRICSMNYHNAWRFKSQALMLCTCFSAP